MDSTLYVVAVLILAGLLSLEFGISSAVTELVAGVFLALLMNVTSMTWLQFLAHFGVLGLMFMVGFEVDPAVIRRTWKASLGVGLISLILPLGGVFALARFAFAMPVPASGLLGIGLSTTSLALVYHFLKERDLLAGEAGQTILGAAMTVDVLSMVGLALWLGHVGWGTAVFVFALVPVLWGLPRLGEWVFRRYRGSVAEFELRFLLMVLVGMGFLAEHAGIHAAVVSFAMGLILSEVVQDHEALEEKLKGIVFSFFAPVFFLRAGTQVQLQGIDFYTLAIMAVFLSSAVGLKYAGTSLAARWLQPGLGHFAGILFNYRLTFGIITATVGLQEGLLDQRLFNVILLVVLASAALLMIFLRDLPYEISR